MNSTILRRAMAMALTLLALLIVLPSCGGSTGDGEGGDKTSQAPEPPAAPSGGMDKSSGEGILTDEDFPDEDYPPLELVYAYDGADNLQLVLLSNTDEELSYRVMLELKGESGWEMPVGAGSYPAGEVEAFGSERVAMPLGGFPLEENSDFRLSCIYAWQGGERASIARLTYGEETQSEARRVFGSAAGDVTWQIGASAASLKVPVEERGAAFASPDPDGVFAYEIRYADLSQIGDKAGAYDHYEVLTPTGASGEAADEGAVLTLTSPAEALRADADYDLRVAVFVLTEDGQSIEAQYTTTHAHTEGE